MCALVATLAAPAAVADDAGEAPRPGADDAWTTLRVGGDLFVATTRVEGRFVSGPSAVETALPDGYPAPTPPGAIELKRYPSVRRAEMTGRDDYDRGSSIAFFPLFNHIKDRDIAMTSPVEVDLHAWDRGAGDSDGWTMSFLYRTPDLGPTGEAGPVQVVDTAPVTVVSVGLRGRYGMRTARAGLEMLESWLAGDGEWQAAGDPRLLYYNGPYVPDDRKWAEVQIPVRRAGDESPSAPTIVELADAAGSFRTLLAAAKAAGLADALAGDDDLTVLAPTDEAFSRLPDGVLDALLRPGNRDRLAALLAAHVVPGRVTALEAVAAGSATTLGGPTIAFAVGDGGRLTANGVALVSTDLAASNGVVHVVDAVLVPAALDLGVVMAETLALAPADLIEIAIERGAPLYNDHQPAACAAVYEVAATSLLGLDADLPAPARRALATALRDIRRQHDPREQAWTLRHALDATYAALH
jgi:uncharacterized surface protein with fasciclin (FAS1) repeats